MTPFAGMRGRTVWLLSNLDWDAPWQPAQEVASRLARTNRVTFVETTGRRLPRPSDARRLARRLGRASRETRGVRVLAPRVLPFPSSRRAARLNAELLLRMLDSTSDPPVVWALLPSPTLLALLDRVPAATLVYHCLLDFTALPNAPAGVAAIEQEVVARAALVAVDSATLLRDRGWSGQCVALLPSGADVEPFVRARGAVVADDVAALPRPVAGFVGSVDHRVDVELVTAAAARAPEWTFAFVGPADRKRRRALDASANVRLLASRPHDRLPSVLAGLDVALIPYTADAPSRTTFPAKLFEYLAAGLPVVATPLPDLEPFAPDVQLAADVGAFVDAIETADRSRAAGERRLALARENDWERRSRDWAAAFRAAGID